MFSLLNSQPVSMWTEVCLTVPGHTALVYHVADELGDVLGFKTMGGRIVLTTDSGIPMIVRKAEGMDNVIIHVRKVAA